MKMTTNNYLANEKRLTFLECERRDLVIAWEDAISDWDKISALQLITDWDVENYADMLRCVRINNQFDAMENE